MEVDIIIGRDVVLYCIAGEVEFDKVEMRQLLDGHDMETRDWVFNLMLSSDLFRSRRVVVGGGTQQQVFASPDFNGTMDQQRERTMERIRFLSRHGAFRNFFSESEADALKRTALFESIGLFDHSLAIKLGVHFHLWGGSILFLGTKRHHDMWLQATEDMDVLGCFAMTELGHGSNVSVPHPGTLPPHLIELLRITGGH